MIFRKIMFVLVTLVFAALALLLIADLSNTRKKMDKHQKKNMSNKNIKTNTRRHSTFNN